MNSENSASGSIAPLVTKFRNVKSGSTVEILLPLPRQVDEGSSAGVWVCEYTVIKDGQAERSEAYSEEAFGSVLLAYTFATSDLVAEEDDWETVGGLPAWLVIPKLVPVSWGFEFYSRIWSHINEQVSQLNAQIENRREKP